MFNGGDPKYSFSIFAVIYVISQVAVCPIFYYLIKV